MKFNIVIVVLCLMICGCSSKRKIITKKSKTQPREVKVESRPTIDNEQRDTNIDEVDEIEEVDDVEVEHTEVPVKIINSTSEYIAVYKDVAIAEMRNYEIPASITLAQGILESGSGRGRLAVEANNHFGIKCHDWTGEKIYHDDDRSQECFRKYKNPTQSFRDHSEFLVNRERYSKLFNLRKDDYKGWAKELRRAGYATDKKYPNKLIDLIERFDLHVYDDAVLKKNRSPQPEKHIVVVGDTLYSIAQSYNLTVDDLKELNKLLTNDIDIGQELFIRDSSDN